MLQVVKLLLQRGLLPVDWSPLSIVVAYKLLKTLAFCQLTGQLLAWYSIVVTYEVLETWA